MSKLNQYEFSIEIEEKIYLWDVSERNSLGENINK